MTTQRAGEFAAARARAELDVLNLRDRAARTVAGQAVDEEDRYRLLAMLGLDECDGTSMLRSGLAGYVHAVASAVGVPIEATDFEVSDTATAYLALAVRWVLRPGRDLMLLWTELHGWSVAVETTPGESPVVLGYLSGDNAVPAPQVVARFVAELVRGAGGPSGRPDFAVKDDRAELARRLARYAS